MLWCTPLDLEGVKDDEQTFGQGFMQILSPSPSSKSYFPPQCRPKSHISEETARVLRILVFQGDSSTRSAQADIHKRSKGIKRFLPETVGALGGMLGDGVRVESVQPRVRC